MHLIIPLYGSFQKKGYPKIGWFIVENPLKMDDLGGKPTIFGNIHILLDQVTIFPNFMAEDSKQLSNPQLKGHMKNDAVHYPWRYTYSNTIFNRFIDV